jgi:hypothetical protein
MKSLYFTLILFAVTHLAHAQVKNDLLRQRLKGKVKSVTELEYNADKDTLRWKITYKYDEKGNLAGFETYSSSGNLFSRSECTYNDSGKLIDQKRYKADGSLFDVTTFSYDEKGNKLEEHDYDAAGKEFQKISYRNDMKGNPITRDSYNEFGALFLKCNNKFDAKGNEIETKEYDSHHGLRFKTTYEYGHYDSQGNWQKKSTYKNDDIFSITEREIEYY